MLSAALLSVVAHPGRVSAAPADLALAALLAGSAAVEVAYAFLDRPDAVVSRRFTADSADGLRAELARMVGEIRDGRFEATPGPQCADCPALDLLCAGPALVTA